ncbi:FxsA family protein [Methylocella sp.]|uniref:FxsA family protein n=1 Tax=Methylocella sp. TaxID=1978226 RepID=UPI003784118E
MRLGAKIPLFLFLWLLAEFAAFAMVTKAVGLMGALLLCLATSLAGAAMLRRVGVSAAFGLRRAMATRQADPALADGLSRAAMMDGALAGLGALLLILPGFVSDFFGVALAAPSVRKWAQERLGGGGSRGARAPDLLDLEPQEWSRIDTPKAVEAGARRRRKRPPSDAPAAESPESARGDAGRGTGTGVERERPGG